MFPKYTTDKLLSIKETSIYELSSWDVQNNYSYVLSRIKPSNENTNGGGIHIYGYFGAMTNPWYIDFFISSRTNLQVSGLIIKEGQGGIFGIYKDADGYFLPYVSILEEYCLIYLTVVYSGMQDSYYSIDYTSITEGVLTSSLTDIVWKMDQTEKLLNLSDISNVAQNDLINTIFN